MLTRDLLDVANLVIARQHVKHVQRDTGLLILSVRPSVRPIQLCLNVCKYRQTFPAVCYGYHSSFFPHYI